MVCVSRADWQKQGWDIKMLCMIHNEVTKSKEKKNNRKCLEIVETVQGLGAHYVFDQIMNSFTSQ